MGLELERLYYNCEYHTTLRLRSVILKTDPHHPACLPIYVTLLVELDNISDLFKLSHSLKDLFLAEGGEFVQVRSELLPLRQVGESPE